MKDQAHVEPTVSAQAYFRHPRNSSRPAPLWNWNGRVSHEYIRQALEQMKAQGFGGAFIHPRPGLQTEYLSEEWFSLWQYALETATDLGLECHLYDENSFPSGFAGGHVFSRFPCGVAQYAVPVHTDELPTAPVCEVLGVYDLINEQPRAIEYELGCEGRLLVIELRKGRVNPWTAWTPYVDTCSPQVAEVFLESTHEAYRKHLGKHFGKAIRYCFTDEPTAAKFEQNDKSPSLPLSRMLLKEFQREHRYDLLSRLTDLFVDSETATATRFDYYMTLQRVWTHNFLRPISDWCQRNGLAYTGHLMEHEWPCPASHPDSMDAFRWFQIPGIDLLAFQFDFENRNGNALYLLNIKEAASVADQLGRERVLSETHGAGGHRVRFDRFKQLCDWQMVHGIDLVTPHMVNQSLAGARKYDWPQTYSDHSPWYAHYHLHTGHVARLTEALRLGKRTNRVLLLHPTTSGWLTYKPSGESEPTESLRESQASLVQYLADHQVDFDLGDELLMRDFAEAFDGCLHLGDCHYSIVILPEGMDNWLGSTLNCLERFLESGGVLLALRDAPRHVNGRPDTAPTELQARHPEQWIALESRTTCIGAIRARSPARITGSGGHDLTPALHHQYRELPGGGALHFLVNTERHSVETKFEVTGRKALILDTANGDARPADTSRRADRLQLTHAFPSHGHLLLLVDSDWEASSAPAARDEKDTWSLPLRFLSAAPQAPNVYPIAYGDIELPGGQVVRDISVLDANERLWKAQGFDQNLWDRTVQFQDNYRRFHFDDYSGFAMRYHFQLESVPTALDLAVERPQLYRCTVNGQPVDFDGASSWLDDEICRAAIVDKVQPGDNLVELRARRFHIDCELDRIYLLGPFTLETAAKGFCIKAGLPDIQPGDWTRLGLPFYSGSIVYRYEVDVPSGTQAWRIAAPQYEGALARIYCDGQLLGPIAFPPYSHESPCPAPGKHEIGIEVVSDLRNLLGPYFGGNQHSQYWAWRSAPVHEVPGEHYQPISQGLLGDPIITI